MLGLVCLIGRLREGVKVGRFLGRIEEIKWRLEKIEVRKAGGLILGGQSHIRKGKVFRGQGLFGGVKKKQ